MGSSSLNSTNIMTPTNISEAIMAERRVTAITFGILGSIGVIINALPIILTYTKQSLRKNFVFSFVANLNFSDLLLNAIFVFGNTFYVLHRESMPELGCKLLGFMIFITAYQEQVFPPLLAVNRYVALYHEHTYHKVYTRRNMVYIIGGSWILCMLAPFTFFMFGQTGYDTDNEHCCVVIEDTAWIVVYWVIVVIPLVTLCDAIMLFCNLKMYRKLKTHNDLVGGVVDYNVVRQNRELLWFLWADMALPICFHTVYHVSKFVFMQRQSVHARRFFAIIFTLNSCVRACLTLTLLRPYREALKSSLYWCAQKKGKVHPATLSTTATEKA